MEMKEKRNSEMSVGDTEDLFKRIGTEGLSGEEIGAKSLTYWADVWRRFRANKLAIFGLILLTLIVLLLFVGPVISGKRLSIHQCGFEKSRPEFGILVRNR
mgnify:CR=1 FL=1